MSRRLFTGIAATLALLLAVTPLFAYTIFLKDGSKIEASEEMRVDGERVIITLPNGTETFIALDEVDLERTRTYNRDNVDGALVIDAGEEKGLPTAPPKARATLRDLITTGQAKTRSRQPTRRPGTLEADEVARSDSGHIDFNSLRRRAYGDLEIMSELRSYFTSQGLEAQVFSGTQSSYPLIEIVTSSESAVFKSLEVAAQALPQLRQRHGTRIAALELLLRTSRGSSGGQFLMTPELAETLNSGSTESSTFFVRNVRF